MRLYCKHAFIYHKPTGFHIRAFVFLIVMLEHFWSICSCKCQNMVTKAHLQVSVNHSCGHFIELNVILLKGITCVKPIFVCSFITMCLSLT